MPLEKVPSLVGVCVRAGTMDKAVKVRTTTQKLDSFLQKKFKIHPTYLLHDPHNSVRAGDIVRFQQFPVPTPSKRIRHMVTEIISPHGPKLEERPPLMSPEQREEILARVGAHQEERKASKEREREENRRWKEEQRRKAWMEVRRMGKRKEREASGQVKLGGIIT